MNCVVRSPNPAVSEAAALGQCGGRYSTPNPPQNCPGSAAGLWQGHELCAGQALRVDLSKRQHLSFRLLAQWHQQLHCWPHSSHSFGPDMASPLLHPCSCSEQKKEEPYKVPISITGLSEPTRFDHQVARGGMSTPRVRCWHYSNRIFFFLEFNVGCLSTFI